MDRTTSRRVEKLLGASLPADPEEAIRVLRAAIRSRREARHRAEGTLRRRPVIELAIEQATLQLRLRTSPELEQLRGMGEDLQLRIHRARHNADQRVLYLARFTEWAEDGTRNPDTTGKAGEEGAGGRGNDIDPSEIPGVVAMRTMIDRYKEMRGITDAIGAAEKAEP